MASKTFSEISQDYGLTITCAADIQPRQIDAARGLEISTDHLALMTVIEREFPTSNPGYHAMIFRRYACLYRGIKTDDAIRAIRAGYSSPSAAMAARVIRKRPYAVNRKAFG